MRLFRSSPQSRSPARSIDGGDVLDRMAARLRQPISGDFRVVLAGELERAVGMVGACPSRITACAVASREAQRIAQVLRIETPAFLNILAEELSEASTQH